MKVFLLILFIASSAFAASYKGFKRLPSAETIVFSEPVIHFLENEKEFLILFSKHAAFYKFPKGKEYAEQVRTFLKDRILSKKNVSAEINPLTTQIFTLGDGQ